MNHGKHGRHGMGTTKHTARRNGAPVVLVMEDGAALFRVRVLWKGCEIWVWDAVVGKAQTYTKASDAERGGWRAVRRLGYRDLFCREGVR